MLNQATKKIFFLQKMWNSRFLVNTAHDPQGSANTQPQAVRVCAPIADEYAQRPEQKLQFFGHNPGKKSIFCAAFRHDKTQLESCL